ncbi:MAG: hypothetical protein ACRDSH_25010 [Pseudonocardiaceae bacterium]
MPILAIQHLPGATADIAAEISAEAAVRGDPPAGLLVHAAAQTEVGLQVIDIWQHEADLQRFQQDRLGPASAVVFARRGITGPPPPPLQVTQVIELITAPGRST